MSGSLVLAMSQSGRTPDVIEYVERSRARGAPTVAVTNEPDSELARVAEVVLPLSAGPEQSVAATKTYTNSVAAIALLAAHVGGGAASTHRPPNVAARLEDLIGEERARRPAMAVQFAFVGRMFVIGRGAEFTTAREIALKLLETCRIAAEPLTATASPTAGRCARRAVPGLGDRLGRREPRAVREAAARARAAGATVVASGAAAREIEGAVYSLPTPRPPLPLLAPLLSVAPGQLFAWALAQARGLDPITRVG